MVNVDKIVCLHAHRVVLRLVAEDAAEVAAEIARVTAPVHVKEDADMAVQVDVLEVTCSFHIKA